MQCHSNFPNISTQQKKQIISIGDLINLTSRHDLLHSFQIAKFPNLDVAPDTKKLGEPPAKLGE
jgi:hypothetical protein